MATFNTLLYNPYFLSATVGADAPFNDLQFIKSLLGYKEVDKEVAEVALEKMKNHGWYLTQELIPFSFFSLEVSSTKRPIWLLAS